jgi:GAGA factor
VCFACVYAGRSDRLDGIEVSAHSHFIEATYTREREELKENIEEAKAGTARGTQKERSREKICDSRIPRNAPECSAMDRQDRGARRRIELRT